MFIPPPPRGVVELTGFWRGFTVSSVILEEVTASVRGWGRRGFII